MSLVCVRRRQCIVIVIMPMAIVLHFPYSHVLEIPPMRALRVPRPPRPAAVLATKRLVHGPRRYTRGMSHGEAGLDCIPRITEEEEEVDSMRLQLQ
jgi:hypothetical protein